MGVCVSKGYVDSLCQHSSNFGFFLTGDEGISIQRNFDCAIENAMYRNSVFIVDD